MKLGRTAEQQAALEEWRQSMTTDLDRQRQDAALNRWNWVQRNWFQIVVVILLAWIAFNIELVVEF